MLAVVCPELLRHLYSYSWILLTKPQELLFSDRHAVYLVVGPINKDKPLPIHDLETTNVRGLPKLSPEKPFIVYFIADVVSTLDHEHHL